MFCKKINLRLFFEYMYNFFFLVLEKIFLCDCVIEVKLSLNYVYCL